MSVVYEPDANRLKSDFFANLSHELRTPLNAIIGFSEFLIDEKPGALNARQKEYLADILSSGRHLLQLINSILDLSKVEAGNMEAHPELFDLRKAIDAVCAGLYRVEAGRSRPPGAAVTTPSQILLVDDDPTVRDATRMFLKAAGYRVRTAASLAEARACAGQHPRPDLLITDYHLGNGQTGIQVIASLRDLLGADLRAILLTGDMVSATKCLQLDERLRLASKPILGRDLLTMIEALLTS